MGTFLASAAFGITVMQTYVYFTSFPNDPTFIHATIWVLLALDISHITLAWHMDYHWLILNFNNPAALGVTVWSLNITVILTGMITMIVQGFYARRVFILSNRNWFMTISIVVLAAARLVAGVVNAVKFFEIQIIAKFPAACEAIVAVSLGSGTAADLLITGCLVYYLRGHTSPGFNTSTDSLVNKIILWTVNNGLLTSVVGIAVLIAFIFSKNNMIYFAIYVTLSKLYINALLATLNSRRVTRGRGVEDESTASMPMSVRGPQSTHRGNFGVASTHKDGGNQISPVVHVVTTTTTDSPYDLEGNKAVEAFPDADESINSANDRRKESWD